MKMCDLKKEMRRKTSLMTVVQYLRVSLTQWMGDLTWKQKAPQASEDDIINRKTAHLHGLEERHCSNAPSTSHIVLHRFCESPVNINGILSRTRENNPEFVWKHQKTLTSQSNLLQKSKTGGTILPDFKIHYTAIMSKTFKHKEYSSIKEVCWPFTAGTFDKSATNTHWRTDIFFSNSCWENWISICRKMKSHLNS